jgi:outer membrane lipoprotein-sorting protein
MKKSILAVILLILVKTTFAQYDPKAFEILEDMSKKYKTYSSFEANISYTLTNKTAKIKEEFKGKITVKGDKFRLALPEQEVINNGTTVWTYLPDAKEVNIDNYDPKSEELAPSKFYDIYKKDFKYLHLKDETEGGVLCDVIDLNPEKKDAQFFRIKMYISKKDRSVVSWTMFDKSGNEFKYTISKFVPNVKVDDTFFAFDIKKYPGVETVDLR